MGTIAKIREHIEQLSAGKTFTADTLRGYSMLTMHIRF